MKKRNRLVLCFFLMNGFIFVYRIDEIVIEMYVKQEPPKEEVKTEEEQTEPKPPSPFVLYVDLHCVGCAKKIERSISKIRGLYTFYVFISHQNFHNRKCM